MKSILLLLTAGGILLAACNDLPAQPKRLTKKIGGPCEGCEAINEYGNKNLTAVDTLLDFFAKGPKLKITGTIFQKDGKTPAKGILLYIYHTNQKGIYPTRGNETGWGRRHGYLRGWIKTGADGKYTFYTLRPASYPDSKNPQHIHATLREPGKNEYWIDEFQFDDDPFLTVAQRRHCQNRGGSGIKKPVQSGNLQVITRNITLGLNIPDYD